MADGKVITGFSAPYVAVYSELGGTITYSDGQVLARGVSIDITPDDPDTENIFYANNGAAERESGSFIGGDITLTVDGLLDTAKKLVMGLPAPTSESVGGDTVDVYHYNDDQVIPYVGVGCVVRWMSGGVVSYSALVLCKCQFNQLSTSAETQEESIDWQTTEMTGRIMLSDNAKHDWKLEGEDQDTEAKAIATVKHLLQIS